MNFALTHHPEVSLPTKTSLFAFANGVSEVFVGPSRHLLVALVVADLDPEQIQAVYAQYRAACQRQGISTDSEDGSRRVALLSEDFFALACRLLGVSDERRRLASEARQWVEDFDAESSSAADDDE